MLTCIEHCTAPKPGASIIWLHGLGADGNDFAPIPEQLDLPMPLRFVFPNAPSIPVTLNYGYVMPAWYDIYALDMAAKTDETGIHKSQGMVEELVEREIARGVPAHRIVLAGFSQGGAIALHTGLRFGQQLGAIVALSTYLPLRKDSNNELCSTKNLPIFMAHGTLDTVIPIEVGRTSKKYLADSGYRVTWQEYPMPHTLCTDEISDIRAFLLRVLPLH